MIGFIVAVLLALAAAGQADRPVFEERPPAIIPAPAPVLVDDPDIIIFEDGTWRDSNGNTGCVTAAPCAYEAYVPEDIELIDPVWAELETDQ